MMIFFLTMVTIGRSLLAQSPIFKSNVKRVRINCPLENFLSFHQRRTMVSLLFRSRAEYIAWVRKKKERLKLPNDFTTNEPNKVSLFVDDSFDMEKADAAGRWVEEERRHRPSAVFICFIDLVRDSFADGKSDAVEKCVLFTRRSMLMRGHPGELSFPGGRIDRGETPVQAALRELHEEVGIAATRVECWCSLRPVRTRSADSLIVPVVGEVFADGKKLEAFKRDVHANAQEVESVFLVPIPSLIQAVHSTTFRLSRLKTVHRYYRLPAFDVPSESVIQIWPQTNDLHPQKLQTRSFSNANGTFRIWGLTATMLHEALSSLLIMNSSDKCEQHVLLSNNLIY